MFSWYQVRYLVAAHSFVARHVRCANDFQGVTVSELDLASLVLLSVAGWGLLQLVVAHWATSVALLKGDN